MKYPYVCDCLVSGADLPMFWLFFHECCATQYPVHGPFWGRLCRAFPLSQWPALGTQLRPVACGLILDKIGAYKGFLIAITIAFIANVLPFLAVDSIMLATGLRFLAGLSSGSLFLIGIKMIGMQAPPDKIAQAQGIQGAAFCLGTMLPFITLPPLGNEAWRFSYIIPAVLSVLTIALSRLLPAKIKGSGASSGGGAAQLLSALKTVSTSLPIWTLGIFHGFSYGTLNNLGQWLPSILADIHGSSTAIACSVFPSPISSAIRQRPAATAKRTPSFW